MDRLAKGESADVSGGPSSRGKGRPGANSSEPEVARQGQAATRHQSEATPCRGDVIRPLDRHDTFKQRRLSDPTHSRQGPSVPNVLRLPWRGGGAVRCLQAQGLARAAMSSLGTQDRANERSLCRFPPGPAVQLHRGRSAGVGASGQEAGDTAQGSREGTQEG